MDISPTITPHTLTTARPTPLYGFGTVAGESDIWMNGNTPVGPARGFASLDQAISGATRASRGFLPAVVVVESDARFYLQTVQWEIDDPEGDPSHATSGPYHAGMFSGSRGTWPPPRPTHPSHEDLDFESDAVRAVVDGAVIIRDAVRSSS